MPDFLPVCVQNVMHSSESGLRSGKITDHALCEHKSGAVSPFMDKLLRIFLITANEHVSQISQISEMNFKVNGEIKKNEKQ